MFGSERGSTMIWWVIALVILFVIAAVLAYSLQGSLTESQKANTDMTTKLADQEQKYREHLSEVGQVAEVTGFKNEGGGSPKPDIAQIKARVEELDKKYEDIQPSDSTLQKVIVRLDDMYTQAMNRLKDAQTALEESQAKEKAAMDQATATAAEKDKNIAQLTADLQGEQSRGADNSTKLQAQIDTLRNQISDGEKKLHDAVTVAKKDKNLLENKLLAKDSQIKEIQDHNHIVRSHDESDGEIIDVSPTTGIAYIDAGFRHGVKPGLRFRVFQWGKGGEKIWKGEVQVRDVEEDMSSVNVISSPDLGNPVAKGDQISSPIFDRNRPPVFVFVGDLPGRFSRDEAKRLLEQAGAKVAEKVTADTDFLVVGNKEKKEGAPDIEETPEYKRALEYGADILTARDLETMLRY